MRKTKDVLFTEENRDRGKTFRITESSALKAERWARRALMALIAADASLGDLDGSGLAGIAILGLQALGKLDGRVADELMDEMLECVTFVINPKTDKEESYQLVPDIHIEELSTLWRLRVEVFGIHTGFSWADFQSMLKSNRSSASSTTQTSPATSE